MHLASSVSHSEDLTTKILTGATHKPALSVYITEGQSWPQLSRSGNPGCCMHCEHEVSNLHEKGRCKGKSKTGHDTCPR